MQDQSTDTTARELLEHALTEQEAALQPTLRLYVWRAGLATGPEATAVAAEVWQEVAVEALQHTARFQPDRPARPWLLGIAANLIKRRQAQTAKHERREPLVQDLVQDDGNALSEAELFDRLAGAVTQAPDKSLEMDETVAAMLNLLPAADQQVIRLAVLLELDGRSLARVLGVKPGTARMRLHRALQRLRLAWLAAAAERQEEQAYE